MSTLYMSKKVEPRSERLWDYLRFVSRTPSCFALVGTHLAVGVKSRRLWPGELMDKWKSQHNNEYVTKCETKQYITFMGKYDF